MSYSNIVTRAKAAPLIPEETTKRSKKRKKKPPRKQK